MALAVAIAFVLWAYVSAVGFAHPSLARATTETELIKSITAKDSDGDGLPDWEETLYGTDPHKVDTRGLGKTDGEAVAEGLIVPKAVADLPAPADATSTTATNLGLSSPGEGSLTDIFSKNFFSIYLAAKDAAGRELTKDEISNLAANAVEKLTASVKPPADFRTARDIRVEGSGADALRTYAATAETVFATHTTNYPKSELEYLKEAVDGNTAALENVRDIAAAYRAIASGLAALTVPIEVRDAHVALVNALAGVGVLANDFTKYDTDPLLVMLATTQYANVVTHLHDAFVNLADVYAKAHVTFSQDEVGAHFVYTVSKQPQAP